MPQKPPSYNEAFSLASQPAAHSIHDLNQPFQTFSQKLLGSKHSTVQSTVPTKILVNQFQAQKSISSSDKVLIVPNNTLSRLRKDNPPLHYSRPDFSVQNISSTYNNNYPILYNKNTPTQPSSINYGQTQGFTNVISNSIHTPQQIYSSYPSHHRKSQPTSTNLIYPQTQPQHQPYNNSYVPQQLYCNSHNVTSHPPQQTSFYDHHNVYNQSVQNSNGASTVHQQAFDNFSGPNQGSTVASFTSSHTSNAPNQMYSFSPQVSNSFPSLGSAYQSNSKLPRPLSVYHS